MDGFMVWHEKHPLNSANSAFVHLELPQIIVIFLSEHDHLSKMDHPSLYALLIIPILPYDSFFLNAGHVFQLIILAL